MDGSHDLTASGADPRIEIEYCQAKRALPFVALVSLGLIALSVWFGAKVLHLEVVGVRAPGRVVRLDVERRSDSRSGIYHYDYRPIVQFRATPQEMVEFEDVIATNPPTHRAGDAVTVLYLAQDPRRSAMIDRGAFWNLALPAAVLFAGFAVAGVVIAAMRWYARRLRSETR